MAVKKLSKEHRRIFEGIAAIELQKYPDFGDVNWQHVCREDLDNPLSLWETGWRFEWSRATDRFTARCNYATKRIAVSAPLAAYRKVPFIINSIRHEVAHAIVGTGHGHGLLWCGAAVMCGALPIPCAPDPLSEEVFNAVKPWAIACQECDWERGRTREDKDIARKRCPICYGVLYSYRRSA